MIVWEQCCERGGSWHTGDLHCHDCCSEDMKRDIETCLSRANSCFSCMSSLGLCVGDFLQQSDTEHVLRIRCDEDLPSAAWADNGTIKIGKELMDTYNTNKGKFCTGILHEVMHTCSYLTQNPHQPNSELDSYAMSNCCAPDAASFYWPSTGAWDLIGNETEVFGDDANHEAVSKKYGTYGYVIVDFDTGEVWCNDGGPQGPPIKGTFLCTLSGLVHSWPLPKTNS